MEPGARTVLVVDDEFSLVETLAEILSWEGYQVVTAPNGKAGLAALERGDVSVVLVDFMMPVMDGIEMIREIRSDPRWAGVRVLLMTAAPMQLPANDGLWDGLLHKPFRAAALLRAISGE